MCRGGKALFSRMYQPFRCETAQEELSISELKRWMRNLCTPPASRCAFLAIHSTREDKFISKWGECLIDLLISLLFFSPLLAWKTGLWQPNGEITGLNLQRDA